MKIKFKNGSTIEVVDDKDETRRGKRSQPSYLYLLSSEELLDVLDVKLYWYQKLYLRFLDSKLMRWVYRFKRFDR